MSDAPIQISNVFPYQSYFDGTFYEAAVLNQGVGQLLVDTKANPAADAAVAGYGIGVDPTSETPVAVEFRRSLGSGSASLVLRPGQIVFPFGREYGDDFSGFKWGLPAGWLGGGRAGLVVLRAPKADLLWHGRPEIIFHRQTMAVQAAGLNLNIAEVATTHNPNWPLRFPSPGTRRPSTTATVPQGGSPILTVEPTSVLLRLRSVLVDPTAAVLTKPSTVRFLFYGTNAFDLDSAGAVITTVVGFQDVTFPSWTKAGLAGSGVHQAAVELRTEGLLVQAGIDPASSGLNTLGVIAVSMGDGDDLLTNWVVDIARFGKL